MLAALLDVDAGLSGPVWPVWEKPIPSKKKPEPDMTGPSEGSAMRTHYDQPAINLRREHEIVGRRKRGGGGATVAKGMRGRHSAAASGADPGAGQCRRHLHGRRHGGTPFAHLPPAGPGRSAAGRNQRHQPCRRFLHRRVGPRTLMIRMPARGLSL